MKHLYKTLEEEVRVPIQLFLPLNYMCLISFFNSTESIALLKITFRFFQLILYDIQRQDKRFKDTALVN